MTVAEMITRHPWGTFHGCKQALCSDGKRRFAKTAETADTFFSIPASVQAKGKSISGFLMPALQDEKSGKIVEGSVEFPGLARDMVFVAYKYGKNHKLLPDKPAYEYL